MCWKKLKYAASAWLFTLYFNFLQKACKIKYILKKTAYLLGLWSLRPKPYHPVISTSHLTRIDPVMTVLSQYWKLSQSRHKRQINLWWQEYSLMSNIINRAFCCSNKFSHLFTKQKFTWQYTLREQITKVRNTIFFSIIFF